MKAGLNTGTDPGGAGPLSRGFEPPPVSEIAKLFPQLQVLEFIGKGGMGAVYKARQPALDRLVALKILPPAAASDPGFAERFNREARALARLNHPNIVAVHDFGQAGTLHYLVMEYVDGGNLRQVETTSRLTPEQALAIVPQICEALQFAHNEGVVHRDIKPENILLDKKGRVKITDFGIAKMLGGAAPDTQLTGARDVVGTPHYMAPEQVEKPQSVDHRADIYSLGVVFYEMLTGELPLGKFVPPSRKVQVDVRLDEVVLQTLEKEPALRYQQASQVKTAVETIARTEAPPPPPEHTEADLAAQALERAIQGRDYVLDIRHCVHRGWEFVRGDFWPVVGVTALIMALLSAASSFGEVSRSVGNVHFNSSVLGILLGGPLMGGLYLYFLKKIRGERARVETAFSGFSHSLLHLILASFVTGVLTVLGFLFFVVPGIYLLVAWFFTLPLVIDKRIDFWPAMRLSLLTITRHWWKFLGFLVVLLLVNLLGVLACGFGVFVSLPVSIAALMYAYEDIVNAPGVPVAPPAGSGSPESISPFKPGALALPHGLGPWLTIFLAGAVIMLLLVFAVVVGFTGQTIGFCLALAAGALALVIFLRVRKSALPKGVVGTALLVFLLVFGTAAFITYEILPESFDSTARVRLTPNTAEASPALVSSTASGPYDPSLIQTECEVMQSEEILGPVIKALNLDQEWGLRYGNGMSLQTSETVALLKNRMYLRRVGKTSLVAITVHDDRRDEAAQIANQIAQVYKDQTNTRPFQVDIVDRALPALHASRPDKPLNLAAGALVGLVLGTGAGLARAAFTGKPKST